MNDDLHDVAIVGAGPVGLTLVAALADQGRDVVLIDRGGAPVADTRALALAWGSRQILSALGAWDGLAGDAAPIETVHISESGRWGVTRLTAGQERVPALGYVVGAAAVHGALDMAAAARSGARRVQGSAVAVDQGIDRITVHLDTDTAVSARLAVAADGAGSPLRTLLGVDAWSLDYRQCAIVCDVQAPRPWPATAFERFTPEGPLALLPRRPIGQYALVMTVTQPDRDRVMSLDDEAFAAVLNARFGPRMGGLTAATPRQAWNLKLIRAQAHTAGRAVILGNAAHTLHPIAGQGLNLGLRDAAALVDLIAASPADPGAATVLRAYADWRRWDQRGATVFTDALARVFAVPLAGAVRSLGLAALDLMPPAKHWLARQTMGVGGRPARLTLGRAQERR